MDDDPFEFNSERLAELFPSTVEVCFSPAIPADARLLPAEAAQVGGMVEKRVREFTHGRHCAHLALKQLRGQTEAILKSEDRSPVWPAGIVGSISHSGEAAAAAVAHASTLRGIGLDIESDEGLSPDIIAMVCRPEEHTKDGERAKLLFCAKEAIYKCIHPLVGVYIDFQEMRVCLQPDEKTFTATPHKKNIDPNITRSLQGKYLRQGGLLIAAAWLPA